MLPEMSHSTTSGGGRVTRRLVRDVEDLAALAQARRGWSPCRSVCAPVGVRPPPAGPPEVERQHEDGGSRPWRESISAALIASKSIVCSFSRSETVSTASSSAPRAGRPVGFLSRRCAHCLRQPPRCREVPAPAVARPCRRRRCHRGCLAGRHSGSRQNISERLRRTDPRARAGEPSWCAVPRRTCDAVCQVHATRSRLLGGQHVGWSDRQARRAAAGGRSA